MAQARGAWSMQWTTVLTHETPYPDPLNLAPQPTAPVPTEVGLC